MLWFALHLSGLPLEALLAALPDLPPSGESARCVVEQRRVRLACPRARAAGVGLLCPQDACGVGPPRGRRPLGAARRGLYRIKSKFT